jgi:hypothetical protein
MSTRLRRVIGVTATTGALIAALLPTAAAGAPTGIASGPTRAQAGVACQVTIGSVNATGDHGLRALQPGTPVSDSGTIVAVRGVYPDGATVMAARANPFPSPDPMQVRVFQWVVLGDALFHAEYTTTDAGTPRPGDPILTRIGGGWAAMRAVEVSGDAFEPAATAKLYALGKDGALYRWNRKGPGWTAKQSFAGFSAVRAMALVRHDASSDTFLMTTNGGALYSVRIPFTSPLAPQVAVLRTRSWQAFDTLVGDPCGSQGTLLAGVDKPSGATYLYAVGALRGTGTVIRGLGPASTTSTEPVLFTWSASPVGF